jgi:type III secretion protein R
VLQKLLLILLLFLPVPVLAAPSATGRENLPNPVVMVIIVGALTLAPFVLIMLSSFVKISVVLSILRNALGTQSVPPNQVITGLAFVLSLFVMTPVARQMYNQAGSIGDTREMFSEASVKNVFDAVQRGKEPLRHFLARHAHDQDRMLFMELATRLEESSKRNSTQVARSESPASASSTPVRPSPAALVPVSQNRAQDAQMPAAAAPNPPAPDVTSAAGAAAQVSTTSPQAAQQPADGPGAARRSELDKNDFQVLIPAFVTSQLKEAFQIGFLVFVPFIIIDMVIANVLLAMGMSMLSPSVISLPFKLLLFVLVDGWFLLVRGLVLSYA